ncbi:helix-turn-helix transcriptional regulator [Paenibacillus sp. FSL P4-0176]|uniref:helix-turn-helix domain-containing protein n=1 Tax=Paenibacillus sp. FSL P4-0176 TaxID=2921631 RepID=UPI0030CCB710
MEIFAQRLKWLRESHALTQKDVADRLGVSQPYYGKFEKATGQPNLETLVQLPKIFHESLDFICGVELLDSYGKYLLEQYCDLRYRTEEARRKIKDSLELLESTNLESSLERKIDLIVEKKASLNRLNEKLKSVHDSITSYMIHIPGLSTITEFAEQEYLDRMYKEYLENRKDKNLD